MVAVSRLDELQVSAWRRVLATGADNVQPLMDLYRPYVDGLENLPADGRFLLVGNHTQMSACEIVLIPYFVRKTVGKRLRPLADRQFGRMRGTQRHLMEAFGGVVGSPEAASALMRANEPVLVFPGGGREIAKFKGEEYKLRWEHRAGFARVAIAHEYPIVTAALVGGDDVYTSVTERDSLWGKASGWLGKRLTGRDDMAMPILRGVGPTLIPRPQRMYLRFGPAICTTGPPGVAADEWILQVKGRVQAQLEGDLAELQELRARDPFRSLNPAAWHSATTAETAAVR
ncbi:glycerol acyltransferase [Mycolicibacterium litorale]|nr:glycerol acyltransferase [Mycolicibacterium litorale]